MASDSTKRTWIILYAMKEVLFGSHYLKGSKGSIPGQSNTGLSRNVELIEDLDINSKTFGVHAGKNSYGTCPGRWKKATNGKQFNKGSDDRDILLPQYLEKLKTVYSKEQ